MAKTVIIFNATKTFDKYSLEQIGLIDYSEVLGNCLWVSYMSRYETDPYVNVDSYPIWGEIKDSVEKEDWSEVYKLGKKFTSKVVKTKDLEMHAECAIKSMMNIMNYDNLSAIVTSEKPKVIMQIIADAINERTDDTSFSWDLKWKLTSSDKENTIVMDFPKYKFKLIPCNNAYQYYGMEDYYDKMDFKMYNDKKLYEKENKIMRKSIKESRSSILDKEFYDLVEEGYIYDEDENGMNMSYGEYATVSDDLWEVLEDELKRYRDFPSAYDAYVEIMNNTSDDAKLFMGVSDEDYFYFSIDEDEGTYDFDGDVPFILEKLFKEFQKETDLERA